MTRRVSIFDKRSRRFLGAGFINPDGTVVMPDGMPSAVDIVAVKPAAMAAVSGDGSFESPFTALEPGQIVDFDVAAARWPAYAENGSWGNDSDPPNFGVYAKLIVTEVGSYTISAFGRGLTQAQGVDIFIYPDSWTPEQAYEAGADTGEPSNDFFYQYADAGHGATTSLIAELQPGVYKIEFGVIEQGMTGGVSFVVTPGEAWPPIYGVVGFYSETDPTHSAVIFWKPDTGFDSYDVYRGISSDTASMEALTNGTSGGSYVDGLGGLIEAGTAASAYYYAVRGKNGYDYGEFSNVVGITVGATAIVGLTATPGLNQAALSWTPVAGAHHYVIIANWLFEEEVQVIVANSTSASVVIGNLLTNGEECTFQVAAISAAGLAFATSDTATATPFMPIAVGIRAYPSGVDSGSGYEPPPGSPYTIVAIGDTGSAGSVYLSRTSDVEVTVQYAIYSNSDVLISSGTLTFAAGDTFNDLPDITAAGGGNYIWGHIELSAPTGAVLASSGGTTFANEDFTNGQKAFPACRIDAVGF